MCYLLPIWDPDVLPATYLGLQCVTCYLFRTSLCYLLPIRVPGGLPPTYFLLLLPPLSHVVTRGPIPGTTVDLSTNLREVSKYPEKGPNWDLYLLLKALSSN